MQYPGLFRLLLCTLLLCTLLLCTLQACMQYPGWPQSLWLDISNRVAAWRNTRQFQRFMQQAGPAAAGILSGRTKDGHCCLEGCSLDGPVFSDDADQFESWAPPALVEARRVFDAHKRRYAQDVTMNRFWGGKALAQWGRCIKNIDIDEDEQEALAAAVADDTMAVEEVPGGKKRKGKTLAAPEKRKSAKVPWIERKSGHSAVDETSEIDVSRLLGARVNVFWNHYGSSKGAIHAYLLINAPTYLFT